VLVLVLLGAAWGLASPLTKIAVSTGHGAFGLIFWQLATGALLLGAVLLLRGRRLPLGARPLGLYLVIAAFGTLIPNGASYTAAAHLPAGIMAIIVALAAIFAFPMAVAAGIDRFGCLRLGGLVCGLAGVALIALPEASLPDPAMAAWLPLALVMPLAYAIEGTLVAKWGTLGLDPVQVLTGASLIGALVALPLAVGSGQWIDPRAGIGRPEAALILSSVLHAAAYVGYVWLIGRAGAVFAAQVGYLVTGFGVLWSMVLLDETYSGWVWLAMAAMLGGLFLVSPRRPEPLAQARGADHDAGRPETAGRGPG
jgi:drug/metabolite transporter (DMT)-like permease